ncbi:hypothetical protein [Nostoc sp. FACHB-133]|uniref:hypothetical protein n=1 Tax=Nostoc sp. FACHB-133 TaxID=2692835 RepID=UPI001687FE35|nr:hypothetical protein [Nostoc sp. FACHB-133]MBD2527654.1 hypothetical protein [Nostoc sp. FACHB-133]
MFTSCIITSAADKQDCTLSQEVPAAKRARMTDTVGAKSPTPATANPQKSHGWSLDAIAVTSHITAAYIVILYDNVT